MLLKSFLKQKTSRLYSIIACTRKATHTGLRKTYSSTSSGGKDELRCRIDAIIARVQAVTQILVKTETDLLQCFLATVVATLGLVPPSGLLALRLRSITLAVTVVLSATSLIPSIPCLTRLTPLPLASSSS